MILKSLAFYDLDFRGDRVRNFYSENKSKVRVTSVKALDPFLFATFTETVDCGILQYSDLNPFVLSAPFLYLLKISENLMVFLMFSGGGERVHWKQMG